MDKSAASVKTLNPKAPRPLLLKLYFDVQRSESPSRNMGSGYFYCLFSEFGSRRLRPPHLGLPVIHPVKVLKVRAWDPNT
jgi:hypothetical protein